MGFEHVVDFVIVANAVVMVFETEKALHGERHSSDDTDDRIDG